MDYAGNGIRKGLDDPRHRDLSWASEDAVAQCAFMKNMKCIQKSTDNVVSRRT